MPSSYTAAAGGAPLAGKVSDRFIPCKAISFPFTPFFYIFGSIPKQPFSPMVYIWNDTINLLIPSIAGGIDDAAFLFPLNYTKSLFPDFLIIPSGWNVPEIATLSLFFSHSSF